MKNIHFVGIGGIGMSGLAAAAADLGMSVSGSDRAAEKPENARIFNALKNQGIMICPQDGCRFAAPDRPDTLIYSTAIEEDNPDFKAACGVKMMHRSGLLGKLLELFGKTSIAVTGSCGKSTVCCYLTETLASLGGDPVMLAGALSKSVQSDRFAGNYRPGKGKYLVFEADESDKSLLNYGADYAIVLNIGTDHYDKDELARVFGEFLRQVRKGAVLTREVYQRVKAVIPEQLPVTVVDPDGGSGTHALAEYRIINTAENPSGEDRRFLELFGIRDVPELKKRLAVAVAGDGRVLPLPAFGRHTAINALCISALLEMLGFSREDSVAALQHFSGVWRRDDFAGNTSGGAAVYDDYAHNPEKILSCLKGMRERCDGRIFAVFQPHGYKPFGFMEEQLFEYMNSFLKTDDRFILLEPYYAGGSSSFSPGGAEVAAKWCRNARHPECFSFVDGREKLHKLLSELPGPDDLIVIMGARDNSLSDFAGSLCAK